jgi:lysine-ketoglutarate reductase/saccharopine dehydrogenase-like protein (TIGR00300 family)
MFTETVEIKGHIIDSLILPKVLDEVLNYNGNFEILEIQIGKKRINPSYARVRIEAQKQEDLARILNRIKQHGAEVLSQEEAVLKSAPEDGLFPDGFYVTTNYQTFVRFGGEWLEVEPPQMDSGIVVDPEERRASAVRFSRLKKGDLVVVGHQGVRVAPLERSETRNVFEFMASSVSSEKPKGVIIREIANQLKAAKASNGKILMVVGPAVVHTGSGPLMVKLIELGYVDVLFGGNALAAHDIEQALFGTSLGISMDEGIPAKEGHEHHIHAINTIRRAGGMKAAVEVGLLKGGIMHACLTHNVDFVLAGSIRDDGPLPEVITDAIEAQEAMRSRLAGVSIALMIASALHSIATGNLLPAKTKTICVDINPAVVTKLVDRGTFQAMGLVTDVEPFFRELLANLAP